MKADDRRLFDVAVVARVPSVALALEAWTAVTARAQPFDEVTRPGRTTAAAARVTRAVSSAEERIEAR